MTSPKTVFKKFNNIVDAVRTPAQVLNPNNHDVFKQVLALWDTGASGTYITYSLARELGLKPTGKKLKINDQDLEDCYVIDIILTDGGGLRGLNVVGMEKINGAAILVGMDVISKGDFLINNYGGKTTFSFIMPPQNMEG